MKPLTELQPLLINDLGVLSDQMAAFPRFRYMGKQVRANDNLAFPSVLTATTVANSVTRLDEFKSLP